MHTLSVSLRSTALPALPQCRSRACFATARHRRGCLNSRSPCIRPRRRGCVRPRRGSQVVRAARLTPHQSLRDSFPSRGSQKRGGGPGRTSDGGRFVKRPCGAERPVSAGVRSGKNPAVGGSGGRVLFGICCSVRCSDQRPNFFSTTEAMRSTVPSMPRRLVSIIRSW